tara:strand:+ start:216 stop:1571 length:1356 start_codon:yes stop_codon:yes gene_type:complete
MLENKIIRIANGQGFWGDSPQAPLDLVADGNIDYLTMDYLAEVTMSIMQKQKNKNPSLGYAKDFIDFLEKSLIDINQKKIKVVTNAGGVNPEECRKKILKLAKKLGIDIKVGIIIGDDIYKDIDKFIEKGTSFNNLDSLQPISDIKDDICSANVYIDSFNISEALSQGADIVLAGRASDPGLVLGPCIYEFNWSKNDYDLIACGTVAGHIIECGAQCSGGNYSKWYEVNDLSNIGYPIIEMQKDGNFIVTKNKNSGGLVNRFTVSEQILYELGDPKNYISPDVIVDFTSIKLDDLGNNQVKVEGIKGKKPTNTFKVSINYHRGYKAVGQITVSGPSAIKKANMITEIIWDRLSRKGLEYSKKNSEFIGFNSCHRGIDKEELDPSEIVLKISVMDSDKNKVNEFGKEIAPLITNGPPGVTGFSGGRPKAQEVIAYWPSLIDKKYIKTEVTIF